MMSPERRARAGGALLVAAQAEIVRLDATLRRIEAMYCGICLRNRDQYSDELLNEITATFSPPNDQGQP